MDGNTEQIILVTPVWNDSARLGGFGPLLAKSLAGSNLSIRWVIADDGSSASERARLEALLKDFTELYPHVAIMGMAERSRKGGAIRKVWEAFPDADWLAFVDADGAISAKDVLRLIEHALAGDDNESVVAIRHQSEETPVHRPLLRRLSFRTFVWLAQRLLGVEFKDTQCGAKVVSGPAYRSVQSRLRETGFAFDAELLVALAQNGFPVVEVPVAWTEQEGGKIHPGLDGWGMVSALLRVRRRIGRYWYRQ